MRAKTEQLNLCRNLPRACTRTGQFSVTFLCKYKLDKFKCAAPPPGAIHFSTYAQAMSLIHGRRCMIAEYLQGNTLLGHGHNGLLVHVRIVYAHAAEDGECLHKVLIVLGEVLQENQLVSFYI